MQKLLPRDGATYSDTNILAIRMAKSIVQTASKHLTKLTEKPMQKSKAEAIAQIQKVGFLPFDQYELFCDMAKSIKLRIEQTKMGDVTRVFIGDVKFYTDSK